MENKKLAITNDYIFKQIFSKKGNESILKDFLIGVLEIHYIQMPKFIKEKRGSKTKLDQWMQFLCQKNDKEVTLVMEKNKEIKKANEEYEYLTGEARDRRIAYLIDKTEKDYNTRLKVEKAIAIAERKKGAD